jgi:hypothetical protein
LEKKRDRVPSSDNGRKFQRVEQTEVCECYDKKYKMNPNGKKIPYFEKCHLPVYSQSTKCRKHFLYPSSCFLKNGNQFAPDSVHFSKKNGGKRKFTNKSQNKKNQRIKKIKI